MNRNNNSGSGGIGVTGLLQVAFIVLKLCGVIEWSWWWVLAPCWIALLIAVVCVILVVLASRS